MLRRLIREQVGMTMGLAVIMIVLIGVMGAGLLTLVRSDLHAVIEVNRGQRAIEMADAGVQAARRELLETSFPESYDGRDPADPLKPESEWSWASVPAACGDLPSGSGKCITIDEGEVRVAIKYLPPPIESPRDPNHAPETLPAGASDYPDGRDYFRVESDGVFDGARRKVQAVLVTEDLGLPAAYFATRDIVIEDGARINNLSLFAAGNVSGVALDTFTGTDLAYGDWRNEHNATARLGTSTLAATSAGVAAEGSVAGSEEGIVYVPVATNAEQKTNPASEADRYKRLDFDAVTDVGFVDGASGGSVASPTPDLYFCDRGNTSPPCTWPEEGAQPGGVITYPFDDEARVDAQLLQSLARVQLDPATGEDNYVEMEGGPASSFTIDRENFYQVTPALGSVFVVRFTGDQRGVVDFVPNGGSSDGCLKGVILVINGDFRTGGWGDGCFDGIISLQDPPPGDSLVYDNASGFTLNGYVSAEGTISMRGSANPIPGGDFLNSPGYHDIEVWSWRECHAEDCT